MLKNQLDQLNEMIKASEDTTEKIIKAIQKDLKASDEDTKEKYKELYETCQLLEMKSVEIDSRLQCDIQELAENLGDHIKKYLRERSDGKSDASKVLNRLTASEKSSGDALTSVRSIS